MSTCPTDEEIAKEILAYLAQHPQAMDTAEGIVTWWLRRHTMRVNVTALSRVLRGLTEKGLLEELGDGMSRRYRLNR